MNKKPWPIIIIAVAYLLAPFFNLLFFSYLFHLTIPQFLETIPSKFAMVQFFLFIPLAGIAIFVVKRWSYILFLIIMIANAIRNYQSWWDHPDTFIVAIFIVAEFVNIILVTYFLIPAVRTIYFNPKLRWWENYPRYIVNIVCKIDGSSSGFDIENIAFGGVFLTKENRETFEDEQVLNLSFSFDEFTFKSKGRVVYFAKRDNKNGYGIQFTEISKESERVLKNMVKRFETSGFKKIEPTILRIEENIYDWLTKLIKTGRGFIPPKVEL